MVLCDRDIRYAIDNGEIDISPLPTGIKIQPASVDLILGSDFLIPIPEQVVSFIEGRPKVEYEKREGSIFLEPGGFVLGRTHEVVRVGALYCGIADGKSTLGRIGLGIHVTAGFLDPGFQGAITLEIWNCAPYGIELVPGQPICQVRFMRMSGPPDRVYGSEGLGSHYQGDRVTTGAR